jgi:hypothetical protein
MEVVRGEMDTDSAVNIRRNDFLKIIEGPLAISN